MSNKTNSKIIKISKAKWDSIYADYKGVWEDYYGEHPEWIGRKTVMSSCLSDDPTELGKLLIEGVHFVIEDSMLIGPIPPAHLSHVGVVGAYILEHLELQCPQHSFSDIIPKPVFSVRY